MTVRKRVSHMSHGHRKVFSKLVMQSHRNESGTSSTSNLSEGQLLEIREILLPMEVVTYNIFYTRLTQSSSSLNKNNNNFAV